MSSILFTASACYVLLAAVQLFSRNKTSLHRLMILCCMLVACIMLYCWAEADGAIARFPPLAYSDISLRFLAFPAVHLTMRSFLNGGTRPVRKYHPYFIGPALIFAVLCAYCAVSVAPYVRAFGTIPDRFGDPFVSMMNFSGDLALTFTFAFSLYTAVRMYRSGRVSRTDAYRKQVVILSLYLVASLPLLANNVVRDFRVFEIVCLAYGVLCMIFILSNTFVYFHGQDDTRSARRPPAEPGWNDSAKKLSARLDELMEKDAPYRDAELTMPNLARMLGVEPKRLSYFFKTSRSTTFRGYINDLRLRAVCRDFAANPDRSIIEAAFANGFNSKSSFNTLFFQAYGKTPREYKRDLNRKSAGAVAVRSSGTKLT